MKRILLLLVTALVVVTSSADNGHSAWMGDFLDMTASQVQGYWRASGYENSRRMASISASLILLLIETPPFSRPLRRRGR